MSSSSLLSDRMSILGEQKLAFVATLRELKDELFSGRLVVTSAQEAKWTLYFYYGRILFACGGTHPVRHWYALLLQYTDNPQRQQVLRSLKSPSTKTFEQCWEYEILHASLLQETISRQQLTNISQAAVLWTVFDIWQSGDFETQAIAEATQLPTTVLIDPEQIAGAAESEWLSWREGNILSYRPDRTIAVVRQDQLQQQTPPTVYRSMMAALDGQSTLREIAAKAKKDVKSFIRTLMPFIENGILAWREIPDLPSPVKVSPPPNESVPQARDENLTIACIDDSRAICEYMKVLVTEAGLNYISITDPSKAMDTLLEHQPDLIFLDLVMPNTSGYEVCSQLRRHDRFKDTPIVILTGNDGIIDRVRAKISGATDFFGKPLSASTFDTVIQTHLLPKTSS